MCACWAWNGLSALFIPRRPTLNLLARQARHHKTASAHPYRTEKVPPALHSPPAQFASPPNSPPRLHSSPHRLATRAIPPHPRFLLYIRSRLTFCLLTLVV